MPDPLKTLDQLAGLADIESAANSSAARDRASAEVVALFDRFRGPLMRYLRSFGVTGVDGEEVVQEVFLSLFRHLILCKSRDNLPAWLFRVTHNLALKQRRKQRGVEFDKRANTSDLVVDPSPSPEEMMIDGQDREVMLAVVRALPEQDRRCLFLRAEGLQYREIAEVLDISLGTVSMCLARSLARMAAARKSRL